jgi:BlaI family transcriptional regulator, penicillinase repressor
VLNEFGNKNAQKALKAPEVTLVTACEGVGHCVLTITNISSRNYYGRRRKNLPEPKLSKLEFQIMEALWTQGELSIREMQEAFAAKRRPAYTTVQTTVYRLEAKGVVRRVRKVGNFHIFAAAVSRDAAQRRLIDDLLALFGGRSQPVMAHLIESGKLTMDDVKEAEKALRKLERKDKS